MKIIQSGFGLLRVNVNEFFPFAYSMEMRFSLSAIASNIRADPIVDISHDDLDTARPIESVRKWNVASKMTNCRWENWYDFCRIIYTLAGVEKETSCIRELRGWRRAIVDVTQQGITIRIDHFCYVRARDQTIYFMVGGFELRRGLLNCKFFLVFGHVTKMI